MAGLIKKQILKHLSKFAKNLSADSINLSTLRGEGELSNLELDCVAIQSLVDLPTWLQINHAKCNRVHVKIPWTKLKTSPITIFLDSVELDMVTCEKPRPPNGPSPIQASASSGDSSYGFIEKVLEGIAVRINSINVNFTSAVFKAEFQLSQLFVYSTDPDGKKTDLRSSRIMNKAWGQVLTFKKVTWQTMRIVTDAATARSGGVTTPIRLITNQATIRIILRRKISDLSVLASQLHIQFDDLLWVLTDAQVQSALLCVKSIRETIERSQQQGRSQNVNKPSSNQTISPPPTPHVADAPPTTPCDPYFMKHVIHETSYHSDIARIDLHICDDGLNNNAEATYKKVIEGGAILITLYNLKMDHYPTHKAGKSRTYFRDYNDISAARDKWAEDIIIKFRKDFVELKKAALSAGFTGPKTSSKLLENCLLFRLGDIEIGEVSSSADKERSNKKIFSSNRKELFLPDDMPLGSVIITDYFFPDGRDYPAPHSNIFIRINAPNVRVHWPSLLWLNQLSLSTIKSVQRMLEDLGVSMGGGDPTDEDHVDIRIETLMPKIFIPSASTNEDPNVPEGIEIQVSQATVTNCRHGENTSRKSLSKVFEQFKDSFLNKNSSFPWNQGHDFDLLHTSFEGHAEGHDMPINKALNADKPQLTSSSLKQKAYKDIWSVWFRQIWLDFIMKDSSSNSKSCPFIDSVPISLWICKTDANLQASRSPKHCQGQKTQSLPSTPYLHYAKDRCTVPKSQSDDCIMTSQLPLSSDDRHNVSTLEKDKNDPEVNKDRPHRRRLLDFYRLTVEESVPPPPVLKTIEGPSGTYILINTEKPLRLMLDHHQFLFLLRLAESVGNIGEKVFNDTTTILSDPSSSIDTLASSSLLDEQVERDTTGVRLILPLVDLFLILRPTPSALKDEEKTTNDEEQEEKSVDQIDLSPQTPQSPSDPLRQSTPDPLRPSNPSDPLRPSIPSDPLHPSNPSDPLRPSIPSDPLSPSVPSDPLRPSSQSDPLRPSTPSDPLRPSSQSDPLRPSTPSDPLRPSTPSSSECSSIDTVSILGDDLSSLSIFSPSNQSFNLEDAPSNGKMERSSLPASPTFGRRRGLTDPSAAIRKKAENRLNSRITELSNLSASTSYENISNRSATISSGYETGSIDSINNSLVTSQEDDCQSVASSGTSSLEQFVFLDVDSLNNTEPTSLVNLDLPNGNISAILNIKSGIGNTEKRLAEQNCSVKANKLMTDSQMTVVDETHQKQPVVDGMVKPEPKMVSVLKIGVCSGIELNVDSHSDGSSIRIVAPQVTLNELGDMTHGGATNLFSQHANSPVKLNQSNPHLRMRIDSGRCASRFYSSCDGHMALQVDDIREKVLGSTLANIGAFLEDDVVPEILPMKITARNVNLTIEDDGEPAYLTSAKLPPVVLNIHNANVTRDEVGDFYVSMESASTSASNIVTSLLPSSNQIETPPKLSTNENNTNDKTVNHESGLAETDQLVHAPVHKPLCRIAKPTIMNGDITSDMTSLEDRLAEVTKERDSLVAALHKMQDDLMTSERERSKLRQQLNAPT